MLWCTPSGFTHNTKSMSIVNKELKIVSFFHGHNLIQFTYLPCHPENTFRNYQYSTTVLS